MFNEAVEVEQRDDFDAHYYYDYHEERRAQQEEIKRQRAYEREERRREIESTLTYKFQSMPMEDQLALIGGVVSIIVLIILGENFSGHSRDTCKTIFSVTYLVIMKRKKIDVQEVAQNIANEKHNSLEKKPHK